MLRVFGGVYRVITQEGPVMWEEEEGWSYQAVSGEDHSCRHADCEVSVVVLALPADV